MSRQGEAENVSFNDWWFDEKRRLQKTDELRLAYLAVYKAWKQCLRMRKKAKKGKNPLKAHMKEFRSKGGYEGQLAFWIETRRMATQRDLKEDLVSLKQAIKEAVVERASKKIAPFDNDRCHLPGKGGYTEFYLRRSTRDEPGEGQVGSRRVVVSKEGHVYHTASHYGANRDVDVNPFYYLGKLDKLRGAND